MSGLISNYKILVKQNLLIESHRGKVDFDSYLNFKKRESKDVLYNPTLNHLLDFKDAIFTTSSQDVSKYADFLKNTPPFIGKRKIAVLTKTPNQVVPSVLLKMNLKNSLLSVEIFTTCQNALEWLNIPNVTFEEVKIILAKLKET
tara:strand:+ start:15444 stop:15878 length:435 start_codon:yes stop_codon:yes gene_type:complete